MPVWASDASCADRWQLTSQEWQGLPWRHGIWAAFPKRGGWQSSCVLEITGDDAGEPDRELGVAMAEACGMPVVTLFDVPNQPLYGHREDDLIAETFSRYLHTRDPKLPLLFPMVQATMAAMRLVQEESEHAGCRVERFVVTGASKRGWTTWLVGTLGDPRVLGIAPRVFDNLDMKAQIAKQMNDWGQPSNEIEDYTRRRLHLMVDTPGGDELLRLVDPIFGLHELAIPVHMIHGACDPYWTVDALSVYWDRIPMPRTVQIVPNADHALRDAGTWLPSLGAFARTCALGEPWSNLEGLNTSRIAAHRTWRAASPTKRFDAAEWTTSHLQALEGFVAEFEEFQIASERGSYCLTTPAHVVRLP